MPEHNADLQQLHGDLEEFEAARQAIAKTGQSYTTPSGRTITRASLDELNIEITRLHRQIAAAVAKRDGAGTPGVKLPNFRRS